MIGPSDPRALRANRRSGPLLRWPLLAAVAVCLSLSLTSALGWAQSESPSSGASSMPQTQPTPLTSPPSLEMPEGLPASVPALPAGLPLDKLPEMPAPPTLPGKLGEILSNPTQGAGAAGSMYTPGTAPSGVVTRLEIGHQKRVVLLPRAGMLYVRQPGTLPAETPGAQVLPEVVQLNLGAELQLGFRRTWYTTVEAQALYLLSGTYGLGGAGKPELLLLEPGSLTAMLGAGVGRFLTLLDAYGLWSRAALKVGYLYPYYGLLWASADINREMNRTPQNYWEITASPALGLMVPLDVSGAEVFQRLGLLAGMQVSVAFIFAPLGG